MKHMLRMGFSLVELLVVIAILGILVGFLVVAGPRALEKAKMAKVISDFRAISSGLHTVYTSDTERSSYPPGYGYRTRESRGKNPSDMPRDQYFCLKPYTAYIGITDATAVLADRFSRNHDADRSGAIDASEYFPVRVVDKNDENSELLAGNLAGPNSGYPNFHFLLDSGKRVLENIKDWEMNVKGPYLYFPVEQKQFAKAKKFWEDRNDYYARTSLSSLGLSFPPNKYDAYVLISVGPQEDTFGITSTPPASFFDSIPLEDRFHVLGLRVYYLATRDANNNGLPDFEWRSRAGGKGDAYPDNYPSTDSSGHPFDPPLNLLPDGTNRGGPLIYHQAD